MEDLTSAKIFVSIVNLIASAVSYGFVQHCTASRPSLSTGPTWMHCTIGPHDGVSRRNPPGLLGMPLSAVWPCLAVALELSQHVVCVASERIPITSTLDCIPLHC